MAAKKARDSGFCVCGKQINERASQRIRLPPHASISVLANLRREIEEGYDHANGGDQLRDRVNRFQLHNQALSNWTWFDESGLIFSQGHVGRLSVGRVTPCAPIVNGKRRAGDCPPYQLGPAIGPRTGWIRPAATGGYKI